MHLHGRPLWSEVVEEEKDNMGQAIGASGAPLAGEVTPDQRQAALDHQPGSQAAAETLAAETIEAAADSKLIAFVAADEYANYEKLVEAGEPQYLRQEGATSPGMRTRKGDVWAKFVNGVLVTDDEKVIEWCDAHSKICRRETGPMTKGWATLKNLQTRKANRERLLDPTEMDADESFPVDGAGDLREQAASPDSAGGQAVEAARLTRESAEREQATGSQ
jgi:hypothetical protein